MKCVLIDSTLVKSITHILQYHSHHHQLIYAENSIIIFHHQRWSYDKIIMFSKYDHHHIQLNHYIIIIKIIINIG
jgi:hypothetical protein